MLNLFKECEVLVVLLAYIRQRTDCGFQQSFVWCTSICISQSHEILTW